MIKCPHSTPKSIYSNIGDLVADLYLDEVHMFWSLSIFSYVLSLSFHFKKKSFSFLFFCLCEYSSGSDQFLENLSQIHCKSFETFLAK